MNDKNCLNDNLEKTDILIIDKKHPLHLKMRKLVSNQISNYVLKTLERNSVRITFFSLFTKQANWEFWPKT